jgi:hypothetical protein
MVFFGERDEPTAVVYQEGSNSGIMVKFSSVRQALRIYLVFR